MPTYPTMMIGTKPTQNKTSAWLPLPVAGVDVYKWWLDCSGTPTELLKATVLLPDDTTFVRETYNTNIKMVNSSPPYIKILLTSDLLTKIGQYKVFTRFGTADGWIEADMATFTVLDDSLPD